MSLAMQEAIRWEQVNFPSPEDRRLREELDKKRDELTWKFIDLLRETTDLLEARIRANRVSSTASSKPQRKR
jgi:hypothetical protein